MFSHQIRADAFISGSLKDQLLTEKFGLSTMSRKNENDLKPNEESNSELKKAKMEETNSLSMSAGTIIEFLDAFEGKQFSEKFKIQNIGRNPVYVKIGEPNSFIFQLKKPIRRAKLLASGCSLTRTVSYTYHSDDLVATSQIPVQINGHFACIPIIVKRARQHIVIQPRTLDFKVINVGAAPKKMIFTILNTGGKRTKFEIDFKRNLVELVVNPMTGIVKAKDFVDIVVEVIGLREGEYYQELWIKTAELPIRVPVLVEVVRPRLEIVHPIGRKDLTLMTFPPAFSGTQKLGSFVFKNYSVERTLYIILAEINGELQFLKNAKSSTTEFKMFTLGSEEGYLKPFENRIINVIFSPLTERKDKGWHHEQSKIEKPAQNKYVVFYRILRVHCLGPEELSLIELKCDNYTNQKKTHGPMSEFNFESSLNHIMTNPENQIDYLRLCFLGEAVELKISIQPSSFEFNDLSLGQKEQRVLKVTNDSAIAVKCRICKTCNVETAPTEVWLKSEKAQEFLVSLTPTSAGSFKTKMNIQILSESDVATTKSKTLKVIAIYTVIFTYNAYVVPSIPSPKLGLGITPLVTDEVGFQKELITFKDAYKLPQVAVLGLKQGFRPGWMRMEEDKLNNVENALVALPNDRPRVFYAWPKDKICRTIFAGFFRYSPPEDLAYTLSPDGRIEKKERRKLWADYISVLRHLRLMKHSDSKELKFYLECGKPCKKAPKIENFKSHSVAQSYETYEMHLKQCECILNDTFVALSPLFLYNIIVKPKLIAFETVCVDVRVEKTIKVKNQNPFPISIRLIGDQAPVTVLENYLIIVPSKSSKVIHIYFQRNILGQYLGFLNYIINENHSFKISITAEVISDTYAKNAEDPSANMEKDPCRSLTGLLMSRNSDLLKVSNKKLGVEFLYNHIDLKEISINFSTKIRPVIKNGNYYDVCFEVICTMPGITVEPQRGVISARSFFPLDVRVQIPVLMSFSFEVVLIINLAENIPLKVTGKVVLPDIRMHPAEVIMRKICAHSFEKFAVCFENAGTTPAEVKIDLKNWPEFNVADGQCKIYLPPKKSQKVVINFEPIDVARYVFYLPVIINGILGPAMIQNRATEYVNFYISEMEDDFRLFGDVFSTKNSKLKIPFSCLNTTVTQCLLRLSSKDIYFFKDSEFDSGPQNLEIINEFTSDVTLCIRNDDLGEDNESPFDLIPVVPKSVEYRLKSMKAHIKKGEKLQLKVTFEPKQPGIYSADIPIFVRGYSYGLVYNYIHLKGELKSPSITPEVSEIHFPPLPLGVGCDTTIVVHLDNYSSPGVINCIVYDPERGSSDCEEEYLTTTWITESDKNQNSVFHTFRLQILFQSLVPIALRNYIVLFDTMGRYATILVTAVADNSSVTDHAFLSMMTTKYKIVRDGFSPLEWKTDEVFLPYPVRKQDVKLQSEMMKTKNTESKSNDGRSSDISKPNSKVNVTNNACSLPIDKGPRLVIQTTKSMRSPTDLNYVKIGKKFTERDSKSTSSTGLAPVESEALSYGTTLTGSLKVSKTSNHPNFGRSDSLIENFYPFFPVYDGECKKYFQETIHNIERWIFEVIMRCDHYLIIPRSFQRVKEQWPAKIIGKKQIEEREDEKDFLDFLSEIIEGDQSIPERPILDTHDSLINKSNLIRSYYAKMLEYLESKGCLLPHIRPEYLMEYENYVTYSQSCEYVDHFFWKLPEIPKVNSIKISLEQANNKSKFEKEELKKTPSDFSSDSWKLYSNEEISRSFAIELEKPGERNSENEDSYKQATDFMQNLLNDTPFEHKVEILDRTAFDARSTQAWLDIIIQIFKVFVMGKIVPKYTIPQVLAVEKSDKILPEAINISTVYNYSKMPKGCKDLTNLDPLTSNIYSIQERVLLVWLNHHLQTQREILWKSQKPCLFEGKIVNNFDKDLSDSVALIAVTASHCPYIVCDYFKEIFPKPKTPGQFNRNAEKLQEAWRTLALGFTLKISDIVKPNPIFMIMLVTYLYEFLPSLHPHSLICFTAPLNSEITRALLLKNDSRERIMYRARFFGKDVDLFYLGENDIVELKHSKVTNLNIKFSVKKVKKISVTLFLNTLSPNFAKHLVFYFEGEPSEFPEYEKFTFTAPLYKVICAEVPIKSPYSEAGNYEIWYTTEQPVYSPDAETSFKPWSKIWNTKVSRRLFINSFKINLLENQVPSILNVTIACLTSQKRYFWLLFHSPSNDFITLIKIKPKLLEYRSVSADFCSKGWSPSASCTCISNSKLTASSSSCPFFMNLMIPKRNEALWYALRRMFLMALNPKEKPFWSENFELNNGIFLILWLLNPDEEKEVIDEFVQVFSTKVTYSLTLESSGSDVTIPGEIEIPDVREASDIAVPVHVSKNASFPLNFKLILTSKNEREIRMLKVTLHPPNSDRCTTVAVEDFEFSNLCQPVCMVESCKSKKKKKGKLLSSKMDE